MPTPTFTTPPATPSRNDPPATFVSRADAFVAWLATFVAEMVQAVSWLLSTSNQASADAAAATNAANTATAAAAAAIAAPGTSATSVTSDTIAAGAGSLTIQTGKAIVPGMWVMIAVTASPSANYMVAIVTAYNSGTGLLNFTTPAGFAIGVGTYSAWTVSLTGPPADAAALAANLAAAKDRAVAFGLLF